MPYQPGAVITASAMPQIVGRARRTTASPTANSGTNVAVLRLDDIPMRANGSYTIRCPNLWPRGSVANNILEVILRYTTDGSTPSGTSAILPGGIGRSPLLPSGSTAISMDVETEYIPASDETFSVTLFIALAVGSGTVGFFADGSGAITEIKVIHNGPDCGDTGVDL